MDTLMVIPGLGIAAENRFRRAGITSCRQLAETSPQEVRNILGYLAQDSDIEGWVRQAQAFVREHAL
jgi:predicted flap endonuclease-1-like 5' DNA nuclease